MAEVEAISRVKFYEVNYKGKVIPNPEHLYFNTLDFFKIHNPTVYQHVLENRPEGLMRISSSSPPTYKPPTRRKKIAAWTKMFGKQLLSFNTAHLVTSLPSSWSHHNPVALQQAFVSIGDPYGVASFAGFVWGHQKTMQHLSRLNVSPSLSNFFGMGVGIVLSSTLYELLIDTDLHNCVFSDNLEISRGACQRAGERWLSQDKYVGFLPDIISLGMAAPASHVTTQATGKLLNSALQTVAKKKTAQIKSLIQALKLTGIARFALSVTHFTVFMFYHEILSPLVYWAWDPVNFNYLGWQLTEELKRDKPEFSRFIRSYKKNKKEMEWLKAHTRELFQFKENYTQCLYNTIRQTRPIKDPITKEFYPPNPRFIRSNKGLRYACDLQTRPDLIIRTNYAFQKAANELRLKVFKEKVINWHTLLTKYVETHEIAREVYKLFRDIKREQLKIGASLPQPQDLNFPGSPPTSQQFLSEEEKAFWEKVHNTFSAKNLRASVDKILGGWPSNSYPNLLYDTKLGHLADYILYSMACGSDLDSEEAPWDLEAIRPKNTSGIKMIRTPFGFSLDFIPPKVTLSGRSICRQHTVRRHYIGARPNMTIENIKENMKKRDDVYTGQWIDRHQKKYTSLYMYILENMDPALLDEGEQPEDFFWWKQNIDSQTAQVWDEYDGTYRRLVKTHLLPELLGGAYQNDWDEQEKHSLLSRVYNLTTLIPSSSKAVGLIDQTYQRLEEDVHLLIDLAIQKRLFTGKLLKNTSDFLRLMGEETEYHRNSLMDWNNEKNLYMRAEEPIEKINKMVDLNNAIIEDIVEQIYMEKGSLSYTSDEYQYLKDLECPSSLSYSERSFFNIFLSDKKGALEKLRQPRDLDYDMDHPLLKQNQASPASRPHSQLSCKDVKNLKGFYKKYIDNGHYSIMMFAIVESMHKKVIDYFSFMVDLTRSLGFHRSNM